MTEPTIKVVAGWGTDNQPAYYVTAGAFVNDKWIEARAVAPTYDEAVRVAVEDFRKLEAENG